jgi:hypothetical protein
MPIGYKELGFRRMDRLSWWGEALLKPLILSGCLGFRCCNYSALVFVMKWSRAIAVALAAGVGAQDAESCKATKNYPGWEGIKYAFIL